jgi:hypothetical protein
VNTIEESQWIKIRLSYPAPEHTEGATEKIQEVKKNLVSLNEQYQYWYIMILILIGDIQFPLDGMHFYCDTYDITRPFPSSHPVTDYNPEFCWNDALASPFERVGLREWCVVLLQGVAISRCHSCEQTFPETEVAPGKVPGLLQPKPQPEVVSAPVDGERIYICLITRKSRINPGTRYTARGLNEEGGPGNECECEFIMWKFIPSSPLPSVQTGTVFWYSYCWRRGTVPLWWKTTLKSSVSIFFTKLCLKYCNCLFMVCFVLIR